MTINGSLCAQNILDAIIGTLFIYAVIYGLCVVAARIATRIISGVKGTRI